MNGRKYKTAGEDTLGRSWARKGYVYRFAFYQISGPFSFFITMCVGLGPTACWEVAGNGRSVSWSLEVTSAPRSVPGAGLGTCMWPVGSIQGALPADKCISHLLAHLMLGGALASLQRPVLRTRNLLLRLPVPFPFPQGSG